MTNNQIIQNTVASAFAPDHLLDLVNAIYPAGKIEERAAHITVEGMDPMQAAVITLAAESFHTFAEWKKLGYSVKKGQHAAIICDLWQYTDKPSRAAVEACTAAGQDAPEKSPHFYMKKSFLFSALQVERIKK